VCEIVPVVSLVVVGITSVASLMVVVSVVSCRQYPGGTEKMMRMRAPRP
jgi:hypothetical protein